MKRLARSSAAAALLAAAFALATTPGRAARHDEAAPPILRGTSGQFTLLRPLERPPPAPFFTETGDRLDLGRFRGKVVLLNFWATWCLPCRIEMPALDRLQARRGGARFAVVAISIDRAGLLAVKPFFRRLGLRNLTIYLDPARRVGDFATTGRTRPAFPLYALPISYLIDDRGRVAGYLPGAADWDSPAARRLIDYYLRRAGRRPVANGRGAGSGRDRPAPR